MCPRACVLARSPMFWALLTGTRFQIGLLVKRNLRGCIQSFSQRRNTGHMFEGDSNCEVLRLNGLCSCNDMVNTRAARRLFEKDSSAHTRRCTLSAFCLSSPDIDAPPTCMHGHTHTNTHGYKGETHSHKRMHTHRHTLICILHLGLIQRKGFWQDKVSL